MADKTLGLVLASLVLLSGCGSKPDDRLEGFAVTSDAGHGHAADTGSSSRVSDPAPDSGPSADDATPPSSGDASAVCPHTGAPVVDPSTLPACGTGGSHCEDPSQLSAAVAAQLATCPTGVCVPDVIIASNDQFIPATCTSLDNAEGRCMNVAFTSVAAEQTLLPQGSCESYERCVPCYSPLDGTVTGACSQGCDPGPTMPMVVFQDCCTPNGGSAPAGKCVPASVVPSAEQPDLDTDGCSPAGSLCVPTEMLAPTFQPPQCSGSTILGSYTGVCLSTCLNFGSATSELDQGNCDSTHLCIPCSNPETGDPTGAPGCM